MAGFSIQPNSYMVPWGADMFRGIPGSMNIQMNQGIADIQARQMMWNVPAFGFGFNAYPSMPMTGLEGLLNPAYTWNQVNWNNAANGGFGNIGMGGFGGGVGAFGGNFNGFGMTSPFTSPFGGSSSTSGSSSTDPDTRRYNRLLNILKKMDNYVQNDPSAHILTEAQRDRLHELATKGSSEKEMRDKYKELKTFFDSISKDDKLKFLEFGSIKLSINGKDNGASLYDALVNSGFEYSDTAIDKADLAGNVNAKLKAISKEDFNLASVLDDVKSYKALDFLSSYYSKYKAGSSDDIIDLFFKAVDKAPKDSRDCVKADFKVLITALINQATDIANEIGGSSKEEILKIADKLGKAYDDFKKDDIKKYFKQLYVAARVGAAKNLELSLKEAYGDIDSSLFGYNSFITKGMKDDLTKEGFSSEYSSMNSKIKATSKSDASDSTKKSKDKEDTTVDHSDLDDVENDTELSQKLRKTSFVDENSVGKVTIGTGNNAKEYNVYKVTNKDVYFIVKDKQVVEVTKNGNNYTIANDALTYKPSEFADKYDEKEDDSENEENNGTVYSGSKFFLNVNEDYKDNINNTLKNIKADDIYSFYCGYNNKPGTYHEYDGHTYEQGLFENLTDNMKGSINKNAIEHMLEATLAYAKKTNSTAVSNEHYKNIENKLKELKNSTDVDAFMNEVEGKVSNGWTLWIAALDNRTCEYLDQETYALLKEIGKEPND